MIERPCKYCNNLFLTNDLRKKTCCGRKRNKTPNREFHKIMSNLRKTFLNPYIQADIRKKRPIIDKTFFWLSYGDE